MVNKKKKIKSFDSFFRFPKSTSCLIALTSVSLFSLSFAEDISSNLLTSFDELFETNESIETESDKDLSFEFSPNEETVDALEVSSPETSFPDLTSLKKHTISWFELKNFSSALLQMKKDSHDAFMKKHLSYSDYKSNFALDSPSVHSSSFQLDQKAFAIKTAPSQEAFTVASDNAIAMLALQVFPYERNYYISLNPSISIFNPHFTAFSELTNQQSYLAKKTHLYFPEFFEELLKEETTFVAKDENSFALEAKLKHTFKATQAEVLFEPSFDTEFHLIAITYDPKEVSTDLSHSDSSISLSETIALKPLDQKVAFTKYASNISELLLNSIEDIKGAQYLDETFYTYTHAEYEPLSISNDISVSISLLSPNSLSSPVMDFSTSSVTIALEAPSQNKSFNKYSKDCDFNSNLLSEEIAKLVDLPKRSFLPENTFDPSSCVAALPTHREDLFLNFFTQTKDTSQIDLNTYKEESFYISKNSYLEHNFYPQESILSHKATHSLIENPLEFALSFFEEVNEEFANTSKLFDFDVRINPNTTALASSEDSNLSDIFKPYPYMLNTEFSYLPTESVLAFAEEVESDLAEIELKPFKQEISSEKPTTIHSENLFFTSRLLSQPTSFDSSEFRDTSVIESILDPLKESSKKFLALQKILRPNLDKYNVLLTLPADMNAKASLSLVNITRVRSPELVENKVKLLPTRFVSGKLNKAVRNTNENLAALPSLQELNTTTLSEEFTTDVQVTPYKNGKGYLFAITIEPISKKLFSRAPHNFLFLVDKSGSIQKPRYDVFRSAVSKSLKYLEEGDTFNIMTFDSKLTRFSKDSVYYSASSKHAAKHFIENQPRSNKYAQPNIYKLLIQAHEISKKSDLPTSVILLTNGKTLEDFSTNNDMLSYLINANNDNFSLYTTCASHSNNQVMLEILATLNKGELMHSQTFAAFPRKVATVVKHAGNLLAHSIRVSATKSPNHIEFFPDPKLSRNLFSDKPYTIIGYSEKLCDFELILQGKHGHDWLNLKKEISLKEATQDGKTLHKELAMYQAYDKYYEFLKHGSTALLDEAEKLLKPYNSRSFY